MSKRKLHELCPYITNVINPYKWLMARQWCHFLPDSYRRVDTVCLSQITLNQKWSRKFEKWCKFSSCVTAKSHKNKLHKMRPPCTAKGTAAVTALQCNEDSLVQQLQEWDGGIRLKLNLNICMNKIKIPQMPWRTIKGKVKGKGKGVPYKARCGPEGSRGFRLPQSMTFGT